MPPISSSTILRTSRPCRWWRRRANEDLLLGRQFRKVYNGTAEERRAAIMALDPEKRKKVWHMVPDNVVEGLPESEEGADAARKKQAEERQAEIAPSAAAARRSAESGSERDCNEWHARASAPRCSPRSMRASSRKWRRLFRRTRLAGQPELRRMGMMTRTPKQVVIGDLREAKRLSRDLFQPAVGGGARGFLVQPLQCV